MEMEKLKIEAKVELKKTEAKTTSHPWGPKEKSLNPSSPKLPCFDEHTDEMDSYLTRFERYAILNKWDPSMRASYLSALLKGRALEVFVRLFKDDQSDYGQIKEVLLTNFDLTECSFRKKFRDCRPEKAETFRLLSGRLASYLDKWLGLAKVEKTYEAVCDFMARDQFLDCCSHELYLYLKSKPFKTLGELAHEADLFADAKGGVPLCITKGQHESKDKEMEMEKLKIEAEVELKKTEAKTTSHPWGPKEKSSNPRSPKLPCFDEHTDEMDSYLTRFESYAILNKWDPSMWASYLSALLKGRALEVFVRLFKDDQSDYGQIKEVLLTNFDLTECSFRKKFRDCKPEKAETFRLLSGRLASYLDKWLGLAKVEKTYEAVCDFMARDQFLDCCSHELYFNLYLKSKPFKTLGELAHEADLFADAKGGVPLCITKGQHESKRVDQVQPKVEPKQDQQPIKCKFCGKPHPTYKCWNKPDNKRVASSAEFNSQYGGDNLNWGQDRNRGRVDQRDNHYDDNNYRTDHQVFFCKIGSSDVGKDQAKFSSPYSSSEVLPHKDSKSTCHFPQLRLPTAVGNANGKEVRVLRDTGCTGQLLEGV